MELLTVQDETAYYWDEVEQLLLAVPVMAENVDFEDACETLVERGIM